MRFLDPEIQSQEPIAEFKPQITQISIFGLLAIPGFEEAANQTYFNL